MKDASTLESHALAVYVVGHLVDKGTEMLVRGHVRELAMLGEQFS
jgi:hypothetical protein